MRESADLRQPYQYVLAKQLQHRTSGELQAGNALSTYGGSSDYVISNANYPS
jgi:hypothetical protein